METCLLCLDTKSKMVGCIIVNSIRWQRENIKNLIEKHLWPMVTINASGGVCISCCNELKTFHKFYVRIKEAHSILSKTKKTKEAKEWIQSESTLCNFKNDNENNEENVDIKVESEILIEQPHVTECVLETQNPLLKNEYDETLEDIPLLQRGKKGRPPKIMVGSQNLNKPNKFDPLAISKKSKETSKNVNVSLEPSFTAILNEGPTIKNDELVIAEHLDAGNIALQANESSDSEYGTHDEKQSQDTHKKKRKNPDEKTRNEHDNIIAEFFKIFCSLCQKSIENFISLRKHFREEHKKRGFVICCKKKIFTRPILVDHIRFHLDPNFFKCKHCNKTYSDRSTLDSHLKSHEDGQQDRNHACDICGKSFVGTIQLETHKLTHAPDYEKQFSCSDCGKFFTTLYSLNYHIQAIHHNKYIKVCDICGKTMRCRNSFKLHMEKHDNKFSTPIHCDICGLRLIDRRGLRRHKNSQHPVGGKKEYSCHICSKVSPNLRALRTHVRFAHETGYTHKCTMCEKAFKRPEALKEHMATHTGTPLYTCPWCPKTFISNGNMHNHRKKSHPEEWVEAQRLKYGGMLPSNDKKIYFKCKY